MPPWQEFAMVDDQLVDGKQRLVPMTKSVVNLNIENAFAILDFELTFTNTTEDSYEASYEFPLSNDFTIGSLRA